MTKQSKNAESKLNSSQNEVKGWLKIVNMIAQLILGIVRSTKTL